MYFVILCLLEQFSNVTFGARWNSSLSPARQLQCNRQEDVNTHWGYAGSEVVLAVVS